MKMFVVTGFYMILLLAGCGSESRDLDSARFCDEQGRRSDLPTGQTGLRALVFLDTRCELCVIEFRELLSHARLFSRGQLIFIRQAEGNASCRWPKAFRKGKAAEHLLFLSETGDWLQSQVSTFPFFLIINKEGRVTGQFEGLVSAAFLQRRLMAGAER